MSKTCKDCLYCSIEGADEARCSGMPWHYPFGGSDTTALDKEACEHFLERDKPTVFDRITASPESLAPKFIFKQWHAFDGKWGWFSLLLMAGDKIDSPWFESYEEAYDATVEKLKEVQCEEK